MYSVRRVVIEGEVFYEVVHPNGSGLGTLYRDSVEPTKIAARLTERRQGGER